MEYPLRGSAGAHTRWEPTGERRQTLGIRSSLGLFLVDERRRPRRHGVACVRHGGTSGCVNAFRAAEVGKRGSVRSAQGWETSWTPSGAALI